MGGNERVEGRGGNEMVGKRRGLPKHWFTSHVLMSKILQNALIAELI